MPNDLNSAVAHHKREVYTTCPKPRKWAAMHGVLRARTALGTRTYHHTNDFIPFHCCVALPVANHIEMCCITSKPACLSALEHRAPLLHCCTHLNATICWHFCQSIAWRHVCHCPEGVPLERS